MRAAFIAARSAMLACSLVAASLSGTASAQPATYRVDPAATTAEFSVGHAEAVTFRGVFRSLHGTIALDAGANTGRVDLIVDARSVATGWWLRDAFIRSALIFDSDRFPVMRFKSTRLDFDHGELRAVEGELSLRGITHPVRLAIAGFACGPGAANRAEGCVASATTRIRRSDYGMDFATDLVGDDVDLRFNVVAPRMGRFERYTF